MKRKLLKKKIGQGAKEANIKAIENAFSVFLIFFCLNFGNFDLAGQNYPPSPTTAARDVGQGPGSPCNRGDHPGQGNGAPPPPPPGLCLPINDFLLPLFFSGILLGAFSLYRSDKTYKIS